MFCVKKEQIYFVYGIIIFYLLFEFFVLNVEMFVFDKKVNMYVNMYVFKLYLNRLGKFNFIMFN